MAKYQLTPYTVEAEQHTGPDSFEKIKELCAKAPYVCWMEIAPDGVLIIETAHDFKYVYPGDYVVLDGDVLMTVYRERFERTHQLV